MTQPHYIDREAVARLIDPISWGALDVYGPEKAAFIGLTTDKSLEKTDAILALIAAPMEAVSPTEADTSLQKVQTTPPDMEAVAWREKVATSLAVAEKLASDLRGYADGCVDARSWGGPTIYPRNPMSETRARLDADALDAILQALAVIPTHGGGDT